MRLRHCNSSVESKSMGEVIIHLERWTCQQYHTAVFKFSLYDQHVLVSRGAYKLSKHNNY